MALTKPAQLTTAFAHAGLKNDIPQATTGSNLASFEEGFPVITMQAIADGGMPPQGQDFNGMFYTLTDIARYAQAGGLYPFDKEFCTAIGGYPLGAILTSLDGAKLYINQVNGNTNNPDTNSTNWQTVLTSTLLDAVPTADSTNPVASNGVFDALATKQNTLTFDNAPTSGSINPVTSGGIKTALDAKQDTLTFDSTPTADSNNPVTSQGIKAAIDAKDSLPSQTGQAGKVLTTDGTAASWQPVQSRNVGEYVWSALPLTDAGLHLLDGSIIAEGGIYDAFVQHVAGLASSYPNAFCTESEWQASVNTYGSCGKFVVTSDGVRLPKVSDILQGTTDVTAVGDLVEAGLPNITGTFSTSYGTSGGVLLSSGGAFSLENQVSRYTHSPDQHQGYDRANFDASSSNSIYGNSSTVQPQTIKALLYICVANSVKTQIQVDIDNVATDLNGKLDKSGGTMTGNIAFNKTGALITRYGVNSIFGIDETKNQIYVASADGTKYLRLGDGGELLWAGKEVERISEGSLLSVQSGYIRYESGLQICWAYKDINKNVEAGGYNTFTWTYPKSFKSTWNVFANSRHDRFNAGAKNATATSATMYYVNDSATHTFTISGMDMLVIGSWK